MPIVSIPGLSNRRNETIGLRANDASVGTRQRLMEDAGESDMKRQRDKLCAGWKVLLLVTLIVFGGCSQHNGSGGQGNIEVSDASGQNDKVLTILSHYAEPETISAEFVRLYPGVTVEWIHIEGETRQQFLDALASGEPPDLMVMDFGLFSEMSGLDLFEDLGKPPYSASAHTDWFPGLDWDRFLSVEGGRMFAVAKDMPAAVTFYRADILDQYGYPSDPEELAVWMEDPANWLAMAVDLKQHDHWIISWSHEPLDLLSYGYGYFDGRMEFVRSSPKFVDMIGVAQQVAQKGLASGINIWNERGQEAVRNGQLVMMYLGEWGMELLRQWAPDTADQWKMTRLPFGVYGIHGGNFFVIPKLATNKGLAWSYIEMTMDMEAPYRDSLTARQWYDRLPAYRGTPLDTRAGQIWMETVSNLLSKGLLPEEIAVQAESAVMDALSSEIGVLRQLVTQDR